MYWIVGTDRTVYGPFTAEQLRHWLAEGRLTPQSQVQREGTGAWTTVAQCPELLPAGAPPPAPPPPPPPPDRPAAPLPSIGHVIVRAYDLRIDGSLERAFALYKLHFGLLLAGTLLYLALPYVAQLPVFVGQLLLALGEGHPGAVVAGVVLIALSLGAALAISAPLLGGLPWPAVRLLRGEAAEIGDFFAGFRRGFGRLVAWPLLVGLALLACLLPALALVGAGAYLHSVDRAPAGTACLVLGGVLALFALGYWTYLYVCWRFAPLLVVDRGLGLWQAMSLSKRKVREQWWSVLALLLLANLIGSVGFILCCIGLVFTLPLQPTILACGYEQIFGRGHL